MDITSSICGWIVMSTAVAAVMADKRQIAELRGAVDHDHIIVILNLRQRLADAGKK